MVTPSEKPLSQVLRELSADEDQRMTIDEMVRAFGPRAFGALLLIFGVACALPLPPGATTVFGAPLVLLAPQVAFGAQAPWLPRKVRERVLSVRDMRRVFQSLLPWLERVERVSRPRLEPLVGPIGDRLIGLVCTMLALVLILPIPLGNILPALAVAVLALALVQRDGALALLGHALTAASVSVLTLAANVIVRSLQHVLGLFGGA